MDLPTIKIRNPSIVNHQFSLFVIVESKVKISNHINLAIVDINFIAKAKYVRF